MKPFDKICLVREVSGLTSAQKLILLTIATHLGENDFCFPSLTTLQKECCLARDNITANLKKLIDLGYIIKTPPSPGFKSNRYSIDFEKISNVVALPAPVDNITPLVVKHYQGSSVALLDQSCSTTRLVAEHYPKRNINKYKNNIKGKNFFVSVDNSQKQSEWRGQQRTEYQTRNGIEQVRNILNSLGVRKH